MVNVPRWISSGSSFLGARALAQVVDRAGQAAERQLVGALDDRHDESPVERHGDSDVYVTPGR